MSMVLNITKLSDQVRVLVIVPVIFELVFITVLVGLLWDVEQKELTESRIKTILAQSYKLTATLYIAGRAAVYTKMTSSPALAEKLDKEFSESMAEISILADDIEKNVRLLNPDDDGFDPVKAAALGGKQALKEVRDRPERGLPGLQMARYEKDMHHYVNVSEQFVRHEEAILSQKPHERMMSRHIMMGWIVFGVILNVLVAFGLAKYFNKEITRRLNTLMDNTFRLASSEQLNPMIGGGDEIAHLDKVFHQMARDLAVASRRKQEMVAMVSHDLRTPLMSIQTALELMAEGVLGEMPAKAKDELAVAAYSATRLIQLINDLLDIDKLEAGKFELHCKDSDVGWIFERCIRSVKALADRHQIQIVVPDEDEDMLIYGDPDRLAQIVTNLIANAVKYSPRGGFISLQCEASDEYTLVRVVDYGRGVPAGMEAKVFERFQQVDSSDEREKKGTGLGLAICKALVDAHHGDIGVSKTPGGGSTFWFKVPRNRNAVAGGALYE